jgi:hypothetical protein
VINSLAIFSLLVGVEVNASTCVNKIPTFNGDISAITTSGNYISRNHSSSYEGWQAFDGVHQSMWISEVFQTPAWIAYEFDSATRIDSYTIDYANGSITTRAPKEFELQGSNGNGWITLDTQTNETNWQGSEKRSYSIANPGFYTHYRLYVTDDNDRRSGVVVISIGELTLGICSCHYGSEQVPVLTGDTASVDASGIFSTSYPAWQAFDESMSSMWISNVWETPAWISYEWNSPRFIDQYSIRYANGDIKTRAPRDWSLQGWNGSDWVIVDARSNQTAWAGSETRSYTVASPGSYLKYRLHVEDDNDNRNGIVVISLGNLSLRGCEL